VAIWVRNLKCIVSRGRKEAFLSFHEFQTSCKVGYFTVSLDTFLFIFVHKHIVETLVHSPLVTTGSIPLLHSHFLMFYLLLINLWTGGVSNALFVSLWEGELSSPPSISLPGHSEFTLSRWGREGEGRPLEMGPENHIKSPRLTL
jgi:hypothetical protein